MPEFETLGCLTHGQDPDDGRWRLRFPGGAAYPCTPSAFAHLQRSVREQRRALLSIPGGGGLMILSEPGCAGCARVSVIGRDGRRRQDVTADVA